MRDHTRGIVLTGVHAIFARETSHACAVLFIGLSCVTGPQPEEGLHVLGVATINRKTFFTYLENPQII